MGTDITRLVYNTFKQEILIAILMLNLEALCRLLFSMLLYNLLEAVVLEGKLTYAIILTIILTVLLYCSQLFRHWACILTESFSCRVRTSFNLLQYQKIASLSLNTIKECQIGTSSIINLVSSDI